jgi:hypothetical protein
MANYMYMGIEYPLVEQTLVEEAEALIDRAYDSMKDWCIGDSFGTPFCNQLSKMRYRCLEVSKTDDNSERAKYLLELADILDNLEK